MSFFKSRKLLIASIGVATASYIGCSETNSGNLIAPPCEQDGGCDTTASSTSGGTGGSTASSTSSGTSGAGGASTTSSASGTGGAGGAMHMDPDAGTDGG